MNGKMARMSAALYGSTAIAGLAAACTIAGQPAYAAPFTYVAPQTNGGDGNPGNAFDNGTPGGPGSSADSYGPYGYINDFMSDGTTPAVAIYNDGGRGGRGGDGASTYTGGVDAGSGGAGGDGGAITLGIGGTLTGTGTNALSVESVGGAGGAGGQTSNQGVGGSGGAGGRGGSIDFSATSGLLATSDSGAAVQFVSRGAAGGNAGNSSGGDGSAGGAGGNGGSVGVTIGAGDQFTRITAAGLGISATSAGGAGGAGGVGAAIVESARGGDGGNGGAGGDVTVNLINASVAAAGAIEDRGPLQAGILAQSAGGTGGAGGDAPNGLGGRTGGSGGGGASGGQVLVNLTDTAISTTGTTAGVLLQSLGADGGAGNNASSVFSATGGLGGNAGFSNQVQFNSAGGSIATRDADADGIVGQSIAGAGAYGGSAASNAATIGGSGGSGGRGGDVILFNGIQQDSGYASGSTITTAGDRSFGMLAQSIGGDGGSAGNATTTGGTVTYAVGGSGGDGGTSGLAFIRNNAAIATSGNAASGIVSQSVGGGGGAGGDAVATGASPQFQVSVAVGGTGGIGGTSGAAEADNANLILTSGAASYGLVAQSIGGGGGIGGSARATSIEVPATDELPTLNAAVAIGAAGGVAGNGGTATVSNDGVVLTGGDGAIGMLAQSIGGGGGAGGSAQASSAAVIPANITVTVGVGGAGGNGGSSSGVVARNSGVVMTVGQEASAIVAQAISGGGGLGGSASATNTALEVEESDTGEALGATVAVGGSGGGGVVDLAGSVTVSNDGGLVTAGDRARGILAQSIGGGGGAGGAAMASGVAGGTLKATVGVGGSGGDGANGNTVSVSNAGSILTGGANADGIVAQSIGGGGGAGGGATLGSGTALNIQIATYLASAAGFSDDLVETGKSGYELKDTFKSGAEQVDELQKLLNGYNQTAAASGGDVEPSPESGEEESSLSINVGTAVAGGAGRGGIGGDVQVVNDGAIETKGPQSRAIFAQSIGGGGGTGGAATSASGTGTLSASIALGGGSGIAGAGGDVAVINDGSLATFGDESHAIFAQSVGGGGGDAGVTNANNSSITGLALAVGGAQGTAPGAGGAISVQDTGTIATHGDGAIGVLAQSIGGGGGTFAFMEGEAGAAEGDGTESAEETNILHQAIVSVSPKNLAAMKLSISGGGLNGSNAGGVDVELGGIANRDGTSAGNAMIQTSGRNAYGVLAQSIGGGGVFASGVELDGTAIFSGDHVGTGGLVNVYLGPNSQIGTTGDGAVGVIAQSVGGGGGLVGGMTDIDLTAPVTALASQSNLGSGGNVTVTLDSSQISTTGYRAHGIVAQSVGGGGGLFASNGTGDGTSTGLVVAGADAGSSTPGTTLPCIASACQTTVSLSNADVLVKGNEAIGIYASSVGNEVPSGPVAERTTVTIDDSSLVQSFNGIGVVLVGRNNYLDNAGSIVAGGGAGRTAVLATGATITNSGMIFGDIVDNGTNAILVNNSGTITANRIDAEQLSNTGTLAVRSAADGSPGTLLIVGNLSSTGTLRFNVQSGSSGAVASDAMVVTGTASLSGTVSVNDVGQRYDVAVLAAGSLQAGGLTVATDRADSYFNVATSVQGNTLHLVSSSIVGPASAALSSNQAGVGAAIQTAFDSGATSIGGVGFGTLSRALTPQTFAASLRQLSGNVLGAVATERSGSVRSIFAAIVDCPAPGGGAVSDDGCVWARGLHLWGSRDDEAGITGYSNRSDGVQFGMQRAIADDWKAGLTFAYENNRLNDDDGPTHVRGDDFTLGAMLKYEPGRLQLVGGLTAGAGGYHSSRSVDLPGISGTAHARSSIEYGALHARASYTFDARNLYLKPQMDADLSVTHADRYRETGAPLALAFADKTIATGTFVPQVEAGARIALGGWELRPFVKGGAVLQTGNDWSVTTRFVGTDTPFKSTTTLPDVMGHVAAGVSVLSSSRVDLRAQYEADLAHDYRSQGATLRLNYRL